MKLNSLNSINLNSETTYIGTKCCKNKELVKSVDKCELVDPQQWRSSIAKLTILSKSRQVFRCEYIYVYMGTIAILQFSIFAEVQINLSKYKMNFCK